MNPVLGTVIFVFIAVIVGIGALLALWGLYRESNPLVVLRDFAKANFKPLLAIGVIVLIIAVAILAWYVPIWLSPGNSQTEIDNQIEHRKAFLTLFGGIAIVATAILTWLRLRVADKQAQAVNRQVQAMEDGQITERYTKAIEQLGCENITIRMGGIFALERIARDSVARGDHRDYHTVIEVLTGFIREKSPLEKIIAIKDVNGNEVKACQIPEPVNQDVQAALTVIGRRDFEYKNGEKYRLDMSMCNLTKIRLVDANLKGVNFQGSRLNEATFWNCHLEGAMCLSAHLKSVSASKTHFENVILAGACLDGARFEFCHLENAFAMASRFDEAILTGAHLQGANFFESSLYMVNYQYAIFDENSKISFDQLLTADSLVDVEGLPKELEQRLKETKPQLFGRNLVDI